ncbi:uncharacterized protein [Montipora foliosa]|uniref:uncharacterized protein n=1 Tax=Montipora foliosa TaxID=591990 RepID=UPI0035F1EED3
MGIAPHPENSHFCVATSSDFGEVSEVSSIFVSRNGCNGGLTLQIIEISDQESLDFEISDEEAYLFSYFPDELDFYDQKCGRVQRRISGKKRSFKAKATKKYHASLNEGEIPSSSKQNGSGVFSANKELRIKELKIENSKRKKENKTKAKRKTAIQKDRPGTALLRKTNETCLKRSLRNTAGECQNKSTAPSTFYNNSDFILCSGHSVKFEDQEFVNLLIELQNRDITPEDYEFLLQLDCSVKPKTLSQAQINCLRSDTVNGVLENLCSICMEEYSPGQETMFLPCGHFFHSHCIQTWLRWTSNKCPIDGKEVQ